MLKMLKIIYFWMLTQTPQDLTGTSFLRKLISVNFPNFFSRCSEPKTNSFATFTNFRASVFSLCTWRPSCCSVTYSYAKHIKAPHRTKRFLAYSIGIRYDDNTFQKFNNFTDQEFLSFWQSFHLFEDMSGGFCVAGAERKS